MGGCQSICSVVARSTTPTTSARSDNSHSKQHRPRRGAWQKPGLVFQSPSADMAIHIEYPTPTHTGISSAVSLIDDAPTHLSYNTAESSARTLSATDTNRNDHDKLRLTGIPNNSIVGGTGIQLHTRSRSATHRRTYSAGNTTTYRSEISRSTTGSKSRSNSTTRRVNSFDLPRGLTPPSTRTAERTNAVDNKNDYGTTDAEVDGDHFGRLSARNDSIIDIGVSSNNYSPKNNDTSSAATAGDATDTSISIPISAISTSTLTSNTVTEITHCTNFDNLIISSARSDSSSVDLELATADADNNSNSKDNNRAAEPCGGATINSNNDAINNNTTTAATRSENENENESAVPASLEPHQNRKKGHRRQNTSIALSKSIVIPAIRIDDNDDTVEDEGSSSTAGYTGANSFTEIEAFPSSPSSPALTLTPPTPQNFNFTGWQSEGGNSSASSLSAVSSSSPPPFLSPKSQSRFVPTKESTTAREGRSSEGKKTLNEYVIIRNLGKGTYGKVKQCININDNKSYAIKICNRSLLKKTRRYSQPTRGPHAGGGGNRNMCALNDLQREIAILKKVDHPNIVKLYEVIDDPTNDRLFMIFEYVEKGAVLELNSAGISDRPPIEESLARKYFCDLLFGIEYLHQNNIVHRDIKPENLLIDSDNNLKITDFGVSHMIGGEGNDSLIKQTRGTPAFASPEECSSGGGIASPLTDIWAMGVTLYAMVFGKVPFMASSHIALMQAIKTEEVKYPANANPFLVDLLRRIFRKNPQQRITIEEMKQHSWLTQGTSTLLREMWTHRKIQVSSHELEHAITESHNCKLSDKFALTVKLKFTVHDWKYKRRSRGGGIKMEDGSYSDTELDSVSSTTSCSSMDDFSDDLSDDDLVGGSGIDSDSSNNNNSSSIKHNNDNSNSNNGSLRAPLRRQRSRSLIVRSTPPIYKADDNDNGGPNNTNNNNSNKHHKRNHTRTSSQTVASLFSETAVAVALPLSNNNNNNSSSSSSSSSTSASNNNKHTTTTVVRPIPPISLVRPRDINSTTTTTTSSTTAITTTTAAATSTTVTTDHYNNHNNRNYNHHHATLSNSCSPIRKLPVSYSKLSVQVDDPFDSSDLLLDSYDLSSISINGISSSSSGGGGGGDNADRGTMVVASRRPGIGSPAFQQQSQSDPTISYHHHHHHHQHQHQHLVCRTHYNHTTTTSSSSNNNTNPPPLLLPSLSTLLTDIMSSPAQSPQYPPPPGSPLQFLPGGISSSSISSSSSSSNNNNNNDNDNDPSTLTEMFPPKTSWLDDS